MKPFVPNQMICAVQSVVEQHPVIGDAPVALSDEALKALVLLISRKQEDELSDFSSLLTRREVSALCGYLQNNCYNVELKKISLVVSYRMDSANYKILFYVWQQAPECIEVLNLLGRFDSAEFQGDNFPVMQGLLGMWANASKPLSAVIQTSTDLGFGDCFSDRISSIGLGRETPLVEYCYRLFFETASIPQFTQEGDNSLSQVLLNSDKATQERILLHLLNFGASAEQKLLPTLRNTYSRAYALWKEPSSNYFPKNNLKAFDTYVWWYNYYQLVSAFSKDADFRRINFWKQHLHKCQCSRYRKHDMLIMTFSEFTVTEFETGGAAYVFSKEYFASDVTKQMARHNTTDFKSWLFHFAKYNDRQEHRTNWENNQTYVLRRLKII